MDSSHKYLERIALATELDKKVAFADVRIGDVTVKGITVWRSGNGKLRVFFPSHKIGNFLQDSIALPVETREEIEAEVIAGYREQKQEAKRKAATEIED